MMNSLPREAIIYNHFFALLNTALCQPPSPAIVSNVHGLIRQSEGSIAAFGKCNRYQMIKKKARYKKRFFGLQFNISLNRIKFWDAF